MREPGDIGAAFPRPGRALRAVLAIVATSAVVGAIVANWAPGGAVGQELFGWLAFSPARLSRPWTLLTSGILTMPNGISHALWSLLGLYFLTNDLERRWGGPRLLRFLAISVILGNVAVLAVDRLPIRNDVFHPGMVLGPFAAITATAIAWAKENQRSQIRLMFFIPMSGKTLYWVTIGFSVLALVFLSGTPEGAAAPFGGVLAGVLFGGTPSPARGAWLRARLAVLRRRGGAVTVESITGRPDRPRSKRTDKSPPLRVVYGGLDDELKNRKPPKDKRYLN